MSFVLLLVVLLAVGIAIQGKVSSQRTELRRLKARKAELAYVNKKIKQVRERGKKIERKFRAIEKLQHGRTKTVRILDEVVTSLPIDRLWLTRLNLTRQGLRLSGIALDNHTVALFMRRLQAASLFKKVRLGTTHRKNVQGHDLMEFDLIVHVAET